jgi:calcineurin-like phosphoesterase family protein
MKRWIITDTHYNHKNIVKYENRPENFKEIIIANCKSMIAPDDELYHLGDVIFSRKGEMFDINAQTPGIKYLTLGNHDGKAQWYKNKGFDVVARYLIVDDILFSHHPMDLKQFIGMGIKYNIHGHFHKKTRKELDRTEKGYPFYSKLHFLLSIEEMDYKPILLDEFLKMKIDGLRTELTKKEFNKLGI